ATSSSVTRSAVGPGPSPTSASRGLASPSGSSAITAASSRPHEDLRALLRPERQRGRPRRSPRPSPRAARRRRGDRPAQGDGELGSRYRGTGALYERGEPASSRIRAHGHRAVPARRRRSARRLEDTARQRWRRLSPAADRATAAPARYRRLGGGLLPP